MMAKGDSVTKNKKSNSYKPYDANNSLIRRLTSRVSQYLPGPSNWLQSFLTPSEQSVQSLSFPPADEDGPGPAKRLRTAQTNTDFGQDPPSVNLNVESRREEEISPIRTVGTHARPDFAVAGPSGLQRKPFIASTPSMAPEAQPSIIPKINGDEASDSESASSSSAPLFGRAFGEKFSHQPFHKKPPTSLIRGPIPGSFKQARVEQSTSLSMKEPYSFDSTVFFSPFKGRLCGSELSPSLLNCSHDSSFYKGNTTFGGASSCTDSLFRTRTLPSETPVIVKPTETVKQSNNLATSTTRILKALEQFSSPVIEARKMAPGRTPVPQRPAPYRELVVPKMPHLLRIKRRDARQLRAANAAARSAAVAASHSSTSPSQAAFTLSSDGNLPPLSQPSQPLSVQARLGTSEPSCSKDFGPAKKPDTTGKTKTPPSPASFGSEKPKTGLFSSLPKLDPGIAKPFPPLSVVKKSDPSSSDGSKTFTFSNPIEFTHEAPPPSSPSSWKFRKPINPETSEKPDSGAKSHQNCAVSSSEAKMVYCPPSQVLLKRKQPPKPQVTDFFGSVLPPNKSLNTKSVTTSSVLLNKHSEKKWECSNCYVQNNESLGKCASCEQPRIAEKPPVVSTVEKKTDFADGKKLNASSTSNPFTDFGDKFKMKKDQWECSACLVRNDVANTKCVSCGQEKKEKISKTASAEGESSSGKTKTQFSFGVDSKTSGMWECKDCYVQNKADSTSCVSCSSNRNKTATNVMCNSVPTPTPTTSATSNPPLASMFKKPEGMWECDSCLVQNKPDASVCIACGAKNPKAKTEAKPSSSSFSCGFSFGVPPEERLAASGDAKPKPTFSFGIKPEATTSSPITFGITSTPSVTTAAPSTTAPTFTFGLPSSTAPTVSTFSFGIPTSSTEKTENPPETNPTNNIFGQPAKSVAKSEEASTNSWEKKNENVPNPSAPTPMTPDVPPEPKVSPFGAPLNNNDPSTSRPAAVFALGKPAGATAISTPALGMPKNMMTASFTSTSSSNPVTTGSSVFSFTSKTEPAVNSLETTVAPNQEVKNIFGSVINKPATFALDAPKTESTSDKLEDKSKLFAFGSSDKTSSLNCNATKVAFSFAAPKTDEPKMNALKPVNAEPAKVGFCSPSPFTSQPNAFSGGFGSTTTTTNSDNKSFSFGGNAGGFSFKPTESSAPAPSFSFGAKPAEQPLVNHTNSMNAISPAPQFGSTGSTFGARPAQETPATGFGSAAPAGTGGFNFQSQQNTSSPFSFATPQATGNSTATPQASSGFSFGASQPQATTQASSGFESSGKTTFSFSAQPSSSSFAAKPAIGGSGGFSFKPSEPSSAFSFSKPNDQALANHTNNLGSAPQFGSSGPAFGAQQGSTMFASPASGGFGTQSTPLASQVFDSAPRQNNVSPFIFSGSQGGARPVNQPGSGFAFGASQPTVGAAPPAFDPNAKPSFNFSSGQQPTFSAGTPGDGMQPIASDSTAIAARKIRKAVRRTVPK